MPALGNRAQGGPPALGAGHSGRFDSGIPYFIIADKWIMKELYFKGRKIYWSLLVLRDFQQSQEN
jgi:hypothetical protein